jgi:hypothetical protein
VGGNARRRAVATAANGARRAVRRRVWPRHLAPPSGRERHAQEHAGAAQRQLDILSPRRVRPTRVRRVWWCSDVAARDVAGRARSSVPRQNQFAEQVFKCDFL